MNLEKIGFTLIDLYYSKEHEVFCFIARENYDNNNNNNNNSYYGRIVVCFRGTASKKQMESNLNYAQKFVDFENLTLTSLDCLDGLHINGNNNNNFFFLIIIII